MCWVVLGAGITTVSARAIKQSKPLPRLLIIGSYYATDFGGEYEVLSAFIVNDSPDTLKFWGTTCRLTEFFEVTKNDYLHLADDECNKAEFEQIVIAPHRSLQVPLKMLIDKQPREILHLKVSMKFYRWFAFDHFIEEKKHHQPEMLTDTIILRYDSDGNSCYGKADFDEMKRKAKLNLPTTELHLLTVVERKLYTVTADEATISEVAEGVYPRTKEKVFRIPVEIKNNSDDTLKYYSMSCSWMDFYHIDNENLAVFNSDCNKNVLKEVIVPPHSAHRDMVPFVCKAKNLKTPISFKVGLNVNKKIDYYTSYEDELFVYNIVWSNKVQLTSN